MAPLFAQKPKPGARAQGDGQNFLTKCILAGVFFGLAYAIVNLELHVSRHTAVVTASQGGSVLQIDKLKPVVVPKARTASSALDSSGIGKLGPLGYPSTAQKVTALSLREHPEVNHQCHVRIRTDFSGEMAGGSKMGADNKQPDPGGCCASCMAHKGSTPCNVWVWNNQTHECWLKYLRHFPERPILWRGDDSPWTGGSFFDYGEPFDGQKHRISVPEAVKQASKLSDYQPPACIHTVLTSNGNSYMNWQTRIMYATYKARAGALAPVNSPRSREVSKRRCCAQPPARHATRYIESCGADICRAACRHLLDSPRRARRSPPATGCRGGRGTQRALQGVHSRAPPLRRRRADARGAPCNRARRSGGASHCLHVDATSPPALTVRLAPFAKTQVPTMRFDPKRCSKENFCSFPVADRSQARAVRTALRPCSTSDLLRRPRASWRGGPPDGPSVRCRVRRRLRTGRRRPTRTSARARPPLRLPRCHRTRTQIQPRPLAPFTSARVAPPSHTPCP